MRVSLLETENDTEKTFTQRQGQRMEGHCRKPGEKLEPPEAERGRKDFS